MALRADGTLWAWGWNEYYQLGDGPTVSPPRKLPVQVQLGGPLTDNTPPTTQVVAPGFDDNWHNSDVTISFTALDAGSGVAATEYKIDDGAWTSGTSVTVTASAGGGNDGVHTVKYRSIDNAGNLETTQFGTVKIEHDHSARSQQQYPDLEPQVRIHLVSEPQSKLLLGSGPGLRRLGPRRLLVYLQSECRRQPDSVADGDDNFKVFTDVEDGTWYFRVRAVDRAGNAGPVTSHTGPVHIDGTAPPAVGLTRRPIPRRRTGTRTTALTSLGARWTTPAAPASRATPTPSIRTRRIRTWTR